MDITKLPIRKLRQRCFVKQSSVLYDKSTYTFQDNIPEQVEKIKGFDAWENFSHTWDILWVGLDPRTITWVIGRHHSPMRKVVYPLTIVPLDNRTKRMMITAEDRHNINKLPLPEAKTIPPESEEDRIISESLSGKVVIDEPDEAKAIRLIESNMKLLQEQLQVLMKGQK